MKKIRRLKFGAGLFTEILGSGLYESRGACLWELVRNGVLACMPSDKWVPGVGNVEILLVPKHPLAPKSTALVLLDRGKGFTEPSLDIYCTVGPTDLDLRNGNGSHGGAAQKRVGRYAGMALNRKIHDEKDLTSGFYVLTRTSSRGPVKFITLIPQRLQDDGGPEEDEITPNSIELGPLRGISGSFSAIVIPDPVFSSYEEIREELKWFIPRRRMFKLLVGGVQLDPPRLASAVNIPIADGEIEAHVEKAKNSDDPSEGIWLTDSATGIRVAFVPRVARQSKLAYPLWSADLAGDIFMRNLLPYQDTARGTLTTRYLKSEDWKRKALVLHGHLLPQLRQMLGNEDTFRSEKLGRMMLDIKGLFDKTFGAADSKGPLTIFPGLDGPGGGRPRPDKPNPNPNPTPTPRPPKPPGPDTPEPPKPRVFPLNFKDETYYAVPRDLGSLTFAEVDDTNPNILYIHNRVYGPMPRDSRAALEHMLMKMIEAVGISKYPQDPIAVRQYSAEMRQYFNGKK